MPFVVCVHVPVQEEDIITISCGSVFVTIFVYPSQIQGVPEDSGKSRGSREDGSEPSAA